MEGLSGRKRDLEWRRRKVREEMERAEVQKEATKKAVMRSGNMRTSKFMQRSRQEEKDASNSRKAQFTVCFMYMPWHLSPTR
jgi:hypothetical protein